MSESPRIYVACLASYNSGILYGQWIDANQDAEAVADKVKDMLTNSPIPNAEEYAIHDHEGFCGITIGEFTTLAEVSAIAQGIAKHGEKFALAYANFRDIDEAQKAIDEDYAGEFDEVENFAAELIGETYSISEGLEYYIDYEAYARDLVLGGDIWTDRDSSGMVHIFWNR